MFVEPLQRRFRWRVVPAGFLFGLGVILFLYTLVMFGVVFFRSGCNIPSSSYRYVAELGKMQLVAVTLVIAGRLILARRWIWGLAASLTAVGVGTTGTWQWVASMLKYLVGE